MCQSHIKLPSRMKRTVSGQDCHELGLHQKGVYLLEFALSFWKTALKHASYVLWNAIVNKVITCYLKDTLTSTLS